jgi:hypothetical protein
VRSPKRVSAGERRSSATSCSPRSPVAGRERGRPRLFANWARVGASPAAAYALNRIYSETDLRDILPAIRVPTLLLYRGDHRESEARNVQRRIPDARLVRIPGDYEWGIFLSPEIALKIQRFLSRAEEAAEPDRVLVTVLFTDLVGGARPHVRRSSATAPGATSWRDTTASYVERSHATEGAR